MIENLPIGISLPDKFRLLRKIEGLSQQAFCDLVGIPQSTIASLEKGRNKTIGVNILTKICDHPRFTKYSIWLMIDELTDEQVDEMLAFLEQLKAAERRED